MEPNCVEVGIEAQGYANISRMVVVESSKRRLDLKSGCLGRLKRYSGGLKGMWFVASRRGLDYAEHNNRILLVGHPV
jgi:hypothetical protein